MNAISDPTGTMAVNGGNSEKSSGVDPFPMAHLDALRDAFLRLYISNRTRFLCMRPTGYYIPRIKSRAMTLAVSNIEKHLMQEYAIAVYGSDNGSIFVCLDVDIHDDELVRRVIEAMVAFGIPCDHVHVSTSGGKGFHIEVFFDDEVSTPMLERFYRWVLEKAGASSKQVEFRPTVRQCVKLPLSRHPHTGRMCWFLDRTTLQPIEDYGYLLGIVPMQANDFVQAVENQCPMEVDASQSVLAPDLRVQDVPVRKLSDMNLLPLCEPATRHQTMVNIAVFLRSHGMDYHSCVDTLSQWLLMQDDALYKTSHDEVKQDIMRIARWACKVEVLKTTGSLSSIVLTPDDLQRMMRHPTYNERKLYFLLMLVERSRHGMCQQEMADIIGLSLRTVVGQIAGMETRKEVEQHHSPLRRTRKGFLCRKHSQYVIMRRAVPEVFAVQWPTKKLVVVVNVNATDLSFEEMYFRAIHECFGELDMRKRMGKREYGAYRAYLDVMKKNEIEKGA